MKRPLSSTLIPLLALLLLLLLLCLAFVAAEDEEMDGRISPPIIYPSYYGPFKSTVKATLVNNAPHADLYYVVEDVSQDIDSAKDTLAGTSVNHPELNPKKLEPSPRGAVKYHRFMGDPIIITKAGWHNLSARAIPRVQGTLNNASVVEWQLFQILKGEFDPPVVDPPAGSYNGVLQVKLSRATTSTRKEACEVKYSIDDPNEDHGWVTLHEGATVELDIIGKHSIFAKCVWKPKKGSSSSSSDTSGADGTEEVKESAVAQFKYFIHPEPMYDYGSECAKCNYKPMAGRWFTIVLQGVQSRDEIFFSSAADGCASQTRRILGTETNNINVVPGQRTWKIWGGAQGPLQVWVCHRPRIDADTYGTGAFQVLPLRDSAQHSYFEIQASDSGVAQAQPPASEITVPPETLSPPVQHKNVGITSSATGFDAITLIIGVFLVAGCVVVTKLVRNMNSYSVMQSRRRAAASADE